MSRMGRGYTLSVKMMWQWVTRLLLNIEGSGYNRIIKREEIINTDKWKPSEKMINRY